MRSMKRECEFDGVARQVVFVVRVVGVAVAYAAVITAMTLFRKKEKRDARIGGGP